MMKENVLLKYYDRIPLYHSDIVIDNMKFVICENPAN